MLKATELRKGNIIAYEGDVMEVVDFHHHTPGNKRGFVQAKLRNLKSGTIVQKKLSASDSFKKVFLDNRSCEYLYQDGSQYVFMDKENYEQYELAGTFVETALPYMLPNADVSVQFLDGAPIHIELPTSVSLKVTEAEPAVRGDTATKVTKNCVCETGLKVKVPAHIKEGDHIKVDTRSGEFVERISQ